jgi:5-methylcytosine-specific restriction enzyme subunit McrC
MNEGKYKVPIRNLFCILCYAREIPELVPAFTSADEDLPHLQLLADLFLKETDHLMKRGLMRGYHEQQEDTNQLSGTILFEKSINHLIAKRPSLICEKDQYDEDILVNQILKVTLLTLFRTNRLLNEAKTQIYQHVSSLQNVSTIALTRRHFFTVRLDRNNKHYQQMLLLARFIYEWMNLSEQKGSDHLMDVLNDDRQMQVIFEKFILNFYQYEQQIYVAKSERLKWQMQGETVALLPEMITDITLIDKASNDKIIMDAKYYADIFLKSFGADKIRSGHLYQLYAYLNHGSGNKITRGILVYPTNGVKVDEVYRLNIQVGSTIQETTVRIFTLDLNQRWESIYRQMFDLLGKPSCGS